MRVNNHHVAGGKQADGPTYQRNAQRSSAQAVQLGELGATLHRARARGGRTRVGLRATRRVHSGQSTAECIAVDVAGSAGAGPVGWEARVEPGLSQRRGRAEDDHCEGLHGRRRPTSRSRPMLNSRPTLAPAWLRSVPCLGHAGDVLSREPPSPRSGVLRGRGGRPPQSNTPLQSNSRARAGPRCRRSTIVALRLSTMAQARGSIQIDPRTQLHDRRRTWTGRTARCRVAGRLCASRGRWSNASTC